ncbi:hypothetical protein STTU_4449 [Streptomyces sp. Tu6071]|nr:hypothetical protein STTU_4449 [Streptomyces sp. Tu6071]
MVPLPVRFPLSVRFPLGVPGLCSCRHACLLVIRLAAGANTRSCGFHPAVT